MGRIYRTIREYIQHKKVTYMGLAQTEERSEARDPLSATVDLPAPGLLRRLFFSLSFVRKRKLEEHGQALQAGSWARRAEWGSRSRGWLTETMTTDMASMSPNSVRKTLEDGECFKPHVQNMRSMGLRTQRNQLIRRRQFPLSATIEANVNCHDEERNAQGAPRLMPSSWCLACLQRS